MHLSLRTLVFPIFISIFVLSGTAHADKVDRLITQLTKGKDYKLRLSAAINLAKIGDERAVPAFLKALDDSDKNVRGVAAISLGKLITNETDGKGRKEVLKTLEHVAAKDDDEFVREQAAKAVEAISQIGTSAGSGGGIFVDVGAMSTKVDEADAMRALMRKTVEKTISKQGTNMMTAWPGGKVPDAMELREKNTKGFHVDGTLMVLETQSKGSTTLVSCKISMLIATYPRKSMFGFLDGGARVQASDSPDDIQYAKEDCIAAVVEDLVAKKIIPAIQTRSN